MTLDEFINKLADAVARGKLKFHLAYGKFIQTEKRGRCPISALDVLKNGPPPPEEHGSWTFFHAAQRLGLAAHDRDLIVWAASSFSGARPEILRRLEVACALREDKPTAAKLKKKKGR